MFQLNTNTTGGSADNLKKLATSSIFITKHVGDAGRTTTTVAQAGGADFGNIVETVGSTKINTYLGVVQNTDLILNPSATYGDTLYLTTYGGNDPLCRMACILPCKTGQQITGFSIQRIQAIYLNGTGVTADFTATLKKMATNGTLTTMATTTKSIAATASNVTLGATFAPVTMNAGDRLVIEYALTRTGGTHNTTNFIYSLHSPNGLYNNIFIY